MISETLGHYRILDKLGAGGMGEVYRAEDTTLDREVAIKVLTEAVAADPERLARFEREAKVLASLSHPNIAHLYGLEKAADQPFLVMELAAGEDLAARLRRGAIPVSEALPMALQIAEALEAAHARGVVHRDLKPANIKVDDEGRIKLLDFGLAKTWLELDHGEVDLSLSPTLTAEMTRAGVVLGTASYMSPEQSRGQEVDAQTDIWAFGVVLYEMLTGVQAFGGDTVTDTIAAIIERQPDWEELPATVPPLVRSLLRRCLQKDRRHRLHDVADARLELAEAMAHPGETTVRPEETGRPASRLRPAAWLAVGLAIGALVAVLVLSGRKGPEVSSPTSVHASIDLIDGTELYMVDNPGLALSRDGSRIAWVAITADGSRQIFLRSLEDPEARPLAGTEGARGPFFSPDGRWIAYFADQGELRKISIEGGAAVTLCETPRASKGGAWGPHGEIVFSYGFNGGLFRVSEDGGEPVPLTEVDREAGDRSHRFPSFLPTGKALVFMAADTDLETFSESRIELLELETGARRVLIEGGMSPRFSPTGHLLYSREGVLMAAPFDAELLELAGFPKQVLEGVVTNEGWGFGQYDIAANGTLLFVPGGPEIYSRRLVQYDRQGRVTVLPIPERVWEGEHSYSPDGRYLAVVDSKASFDVWLWGLERQILTRLTRGGNNQAPTWSPDSRRLIFKSDRRGTEGTDLYWTRVDGSQPEQMLLETEATVWPTSWSPDGQELLYSRLDPERSYDVLTLPIGEEMSPGTPRLVLGTPGLDYEGKFSPDGRWLAYRSDQTGRAEIFVRSFPGPGPVRQVSSQGGMRPQWGRDGREIFYVEPATQRLMTVAMGTSPELRLSAPEALFVFDSPRTFYAVTPDGDHFVFLQAGTEARPVEQLRIVFHWATELERRIPTP